MLNYLPRLTTLCLIATLALSDTETPEGFPSPLTSNNFKETLSQGLHLVEFYSPYCSHCKSFAPTWEKTWQNFHDEGTKVGIGMVQVDCVESGDLCNDEKILAYPSLKLYGPDGFIKNYPKSYSRNEESLLKFMRKQALELSDPNLNVESLSQLISTENMVNYLLDPIAQPLLISFWPSYELEDLNTIDAKKFFTDNDEEAISFQRTWKIVSNQVDKSIKVGHFNCLANKKICSELGMNLKNPGVALFLPNLPTGKIIPYDQSIYSLTPFDIVSFTSRVTKIATFSEIQTLELAETYGIMPHVNDLSAFPEVSQTYFVYLYDSETVSKEDFDILPYLIDPLSKLPGTHFFKSNDSTMLSLAEIQKRTVPKAVNNKLEIDMVPEVDEKRLLFEMSTTLPTLLCFKERSMLPEVYHSDSPTDIRDQFKVIDWIKKNSAPYIDEYNVQKMRKYFAKPSGKLALMLLEKKDDSATNLKLLNRFMVDNLKYNDVLNNHIYNQVFQNRRDKVAKYDQMKSQDQDTKLLLGQLAKEITPTQFEQVHIGYMDLSHGDILSQIGVSVDNTNFTTGDIIIFDGSKLYYDFDSELKTSIKPERLSVSLLMTQGLVKNKNWAKVRDSPFSETFRILDKIYQYGPLGYLGLSALMLLIFKGRNKFVNMVLTRVPKRNDFNSQERAGKLV